MARFGWAYINCSGAADGAASGPSGSVQIKDGSAAHSTGSAYLKYFAGVDVSPSKTGGYQPSTMVLSGTMIISGTLSASVYNYENITVIDATGSTFFGNTNDLRYRAIKLSNLLLTKNKLSYIFFNLRFV